VKSVSAKPTPEVLERYLQLKDRTTTW